MSVRLNLNSRGALSDHFGDASLLLRFAAPVASVFQIAAAVPGGASGDVDQVGGIVTPQALV
jgi:hypothetical protein